MVTTSPASIAPSSAIGYSGIFGKQIAIVSPFLNFNLVCSLTASAAD